MNPPTPSIPGPNIQSLAPASITGMVPPPPRTGSGVIPARATPKPPADAPADAAQHEGMVPVVIGKPPKQNAFLQYWRKVGGGSLTISILIHAGLIALFVVIVTVTVHEPKVDFLPGGGSKQGAEASSELAHQVQQKKRTALNKMTPMKKVVSQSLNAAINLPDLPIDAIDVPDMAIPMGGMSASSGFGSMGAGGGFGEGHGIGGMKGVAFKPVFMFGRELKDSRKIAVVMDVSRSMTRYLPAVAKELDKIASQSVLVLYFGCGLAEPKQGVKIKGEASKTTGDSFASFWQHWQGKGSLKLTPEERMKLTYDRNRPMPLEDIYKIMNGRRNTYFVDFDGILYAWTALLCKEVVDADTIYWFSDFMDKVDDSKLEEVRLKMKSRKQKLVMHASVRGRNFEKLRDGLALPLGGEVIEAEVKK